MARLCINLGNIFKPNKIEADIVDVLTAMHKRASRLKQLIPEVVFSIPIFHFAQGVWEPFRDVTKVLTYGSEMKGPFNYFKEITTKWYVF